MGSHGIKDKVAIVSMGCTVLRRAVGQGLRRPGPRGRRPGHCADGGAVRLADVDAFWLGTAQSAMSGIGPRPRPRHRRQAGEPGRELLRHRLRGAAPGGLRRRLRRLRRGHGRRRREGEGRRLPGPQRLPDPPRRHQPHAHRGGDVLDGRARLRRALRRRPRRAAPVPRPHRRQEPLQRRPQPAGPVPQGDQRGGRVRGADGRRPARRPRLRRRGRRRRRRRRRAGRGRPPLHRHAAVREGDVARRRRRQRPRRPRPTTTRPSARSSAPPRTPTPRPASPTPPASWPWPRCTTASRRPSSCSWRTSGCRARGTAWKDVLGRPLRPRRRAADQPRRRPEVLRPPRRRVGPADALRGVAPAPGRGPRGPPHLDRTATATWRSPTTSAATPARW